MNFFSPNIQKHGRIARGLLALAILTCAVFAFYTAVWLGAILLLVGLFALFEALRGWCVLRACGIKTKW